MSVELTYFDMSGLGEPVRVMLSYGNIPFIDKRVSKEEWPQLKSEMKFGQLPRLRIDGVELYQSRAICRFIATKLELRGKDTKEAALTDMWVDTFDDMRSMITKWYYLPDSEERTKNLERLKNSDLPKVLTVFENALAQENSKFLVNNEITWADVMLFAYLAYIGELLKRSGEEILANHSHLLGIYQTVKNSPGIQKWLKNRTPSPPDMRALFM